MGWGGVAQRNVVHGLYPRLGQAALQDVVTRHRGFHHVGREERGDDRHGHNDRVEKLADYAERQAERGDDERELADLGHGEAAAHGRLQRLAA